MKKKTIWIIVLVMALLGGGFVGYRVLASDSSEATTSLQTATVERGSVSSTLSASGNTRSGQSATLNWGTSGKVGEVTIKLGDRVEVDQVLAALDPTTLSTDMINARQDLLNAKEALEDLLNSQLQQAQALQAVEDAQLALDSLKQAASEEASQAQLALANAQSGLEDAQKTRNKMNYPHSTNQLVIEKAQTEYLLAKQAYKEALKTYNKYKDKALTKPERVQALNNLVAAETRMNKALATWNWYMLGYSDLEIAEAEAALAVAQANLDKAQVDYERLKDGTSAAAIALAEAKLAEAKRSWESVKDGPSQEEVDAAQAAVDAAQAVLEQSALEAPFNGVVTVVDVKTGDLVSKGDNAFRIDDLDSIYIDLQISEIDLASLEVGQQATLEFDAIPDKIYSGEVTEIGMIPSVSQGIVNYPVTVVITNPDEDIRPGMTAAVTLIIDQREDVLLVPNRAIKNSAGQQYVTVLFEGQQITLPVRVGLVGDSMSEVISDQLREGDAVVINGSSSTTTTTTNTGQRQFMGGPNDMGVPPMGMP